MITFSEYLLLETRNLYEKATQDAMRIIFPKIKGILLKRIPSNKKTIDFPASEVFPRLSHSTVDMLRITIIRTDKDKVKATAEYSLNDDIPGIDGLMDVQLYVPKNPKEGSHTLLEAVYFRLTTVIRHELEHAAQSDRGKEVGKIFKNIFDIKNQFFSIKSYKEDEKINMKNFDNKMKYLNHQDEIEAWASSMYMVAKKQKEDFKDVLAKTIYGFFSSKNEDEFNNKLNSLEPENKKIILFQLQNWKKNIINYIKKRYPDITL